MKPRNTLVAFVALCAALAWVYWGEIKGKEKKTAREEAEKKLLDVKEDRITGLTFTTDKGKVALEKADGKWRIVEPIKTDGDPFTPQDAARALGDLKKTDTVAAAPTADQLKEYGLEPVTLSVAYGTADGKGSAIEVGTKNPLKDAYYVRVKGAPAVVLVDGATVGAFRKDLFALRSKKLLDFNEDEVTDIEIATPDHAAVLRRADKASPWMMTAPYKDLARAETVRTLLSTLRYLEALRFVSEDGAGLPGFGLAPEAIKIKLVAGPAAAAQTLMIGVKVNGEDSVFVKRDEMPFVATVGTNLLTDAGKTPDELRENRAFPFDRYDMKLLEVQGKDKGVKLSKEAGSDWKVAPVPGKEEPAAWRAVDDFLREVSELTAAQFLDAAPASISFDAPTVTVTYQGTGEPEPTVAQVVAAADGCYVKNPRRTAILKLAADAVSKLQKDAGAFIEKTPEATPSIVETPPASAAPSPTGPTGDPGR
ncbi:MAG: DUF4340 domain-containing protein [Acidobacteriota bacterium]